MIDSLNNTITATTKKAPPEWALLERLLIDTMNKAALEFVNLVTRPDRTLIWRESWAGMDGSDDPYEGFMKFPLFYALGGSEEIHQLSREIWDAITWQWTQYGQIHDEFDGYYDWMHHGEGYLFFYFLGLANPYVLKDRQRTLKFASFYTGENPDVPNFDSEKKMMRSPITGSKGPRFVQTEEDWQTHREILDNYMPPFEDIPGIAKDAATCNWSDDAIYREILKRINERQARGDVPLNLCSTSMMSHAYLYTTDEKYRKWIVEYLEAWKERTRRNGGIIPDNIGLSGEIGEYNDGKWWGGYYGWRWPHGAFSLLEPLIVAGSNAVLLTGDMSHLELARSQVDMLWDLRKQEGDKWLVPNRHFDDGWSDYRYMHPMYGVHLWNISMQEEDAERAERGWVSELFDPLESTESGGENTIGLHLSFHGNIAQWFRYMRGKDPSYPVKLLKMNYEVIRSQLERMRAPENDPRIKDHYAESMSIHQWQDISPMIMEGLTQLTLGGPMHVYHGGLQHARVRYYDAAKRRPGLPESVGALVEKLGDRSAIVHLVNLSLQDDRELIVQAGVFGEHNFTAAYELDETGERIGTFTASGKWLPIRLPVGTSIRLELEMDRYVNTPSYDTPWPDPECNFVIRGREL